MTTKLYYYLLFIFFAFSCSNPSTSESIEQVDDKHKIDNGLMSDILMDSLLHQALEKGNCKAYREVYMPYYWKYRGREVIYYSFIMANKYNCPEAFFDVYHSLVFPKNDSIGLKSIDSKTKNLALYYLLKSYELGEDNAKSKVEELFAGKPIPKSSYYMQEYAKE